MSFTGTVRNGVIRLHPEIKLPDGIEVRVTPVAPIREDLGNYRGSDPDFEAAIAAFADAEVSETDPLEGTAVDLPSDPSAREQLRKLLAGG